MAKVWPVYEGKEPTSGGPWADLPVSEAVALFELRQDDIESDLKATPRFGDVNRDLTYAGYKHIVVEIGQSEGRKAKWRPGFFRSRITPKEAFDLLIRQALTAVLGGKNVVRVESRPTTDSQDREALKVMVVIAPDAVREIEGPAVLDALVKVRERLREMKDERSPIIEYATEAELEEVGGPQS